MRKTATTGICLLFAAFLVAQETLDPNEVSLRSAVYFPRAQFSLRTDVRLVEVLVVVRDRQGQTVAGLQPGHFEVRDAGKKREITAFSVQTATRAAPPAASGAPPIAAAPAAPAPEVRPRFVGIVFDDLNSDFPAFRRTQVAARRFVKEGLSSGDQVGIFSTYGQQILPFTSNVDTLVAAIDKLKFRAQKFAGGLCPKMSAYESYLIANNLDPQALDVKVAETSRCNPTRDARAVPGRSRTPGISSAPDPQDKLVTYVVSQANANWNEVRARSFNTLDAIQGIADFMGSLPGSRMLLLASGGFLSGTLTVEQDNLISHALKAGVVINSLDAKGLYTLDPDMPPGGDAQSLIFQQSALTREMIASNDAMAVLAKSTGGRFFDNSNDLAAGFRQLGSQPEVTYLLGFRPDPQPNDRYHKLEVRLSGGSRHSVQSRPGYFASKEQPVEQAAERRIDRELFGAGSRTEVPASITTTVDKQTGSATRLTATVHVNVRQLGFLDRSGLRSQKLSFLVALLDEQGNFVAGREGSMAFSLRDSTFTRLSARGLGADFQFEPPPGRYRLRGLIEEANQGQLTIINQVVEIP